MTEVGLGFSLRRPALIKCSIPSGPSIVLLTLFSGELVVASNDYEATKVKVPAYIILRYGGMPSAQVTI